MTVEFYGNEVHGRCFDSRADSWWDIHYFVGQRHGRSRESYRDDEYYFHGEKVDQETWLELSREERTPHGSSEAFPEIEYTKEGKILRKSHSFKEKACVMNYDRPEGKLTAQYYCIETSYSMIRHGIATLFDDKGNPTEKYFFNNQEISGKDEYDDLVKQETTALFSDMTVAEVTVSEYGQSAFSKPQGPRYLKQYHDKNNPHLGIMEDYAANYKPLCQRRYLKNSGGILQLNIKNNTFESEEFYRDHQKHGVWRDRDGKATYYDKDQKIPQYKWWLRQNVQDILSGRLSKVLLSPFARNIDPLQKAIKDAMPIVHTDKPVAYVGVRI